MHGLQATWTPEGTLFFWTPEGDLRRVLARDAPWLGAGVGKAGVRYLASAGAGDRRQRTRGVEVDLAHALAGLATLDADAPVSDSVRCLALATKLALELAARHRAIPTVEQGEARWRALLTRPRDRERFRALADGLPPAARAVPTAEQSRRPVRLRPASTTLRDFVDGVIDTVYRTDAWPGTARGWVLELAEALRSAPSAFSPRDARYQGIPEQIRDWAGEAEGSGLRLGFSLAIGEEGADFRLRPYVHPVGDPTRRISMDEAWDAGGSVQIDGRRFGHPADVVVRGLARAARLHPPLAAALDGARPQELAFDARKTWRFLSEGVALLREAGFEVDLPEAFAAAGSRRLRPRMRVGVTLDDDGRIDLSRALEFHWEVALGDLVLTGDEFAELTRSGEPLVRFRGDWVLLDPGELARLPSGVGRAGVLPAAVALRAVLTGEHEGVPVVADDRLRLVLEALRQPPPQPAPDGLHATLRPYQAHGYSWLTMMGTLGLGCCLADDMGLGKTVQLVTHLLGRRHDRRGEARPSLVVCPTSVLGNWQRELARFAPSLRVARYHGLSRELDDLAELDVVVTTYGLLVRDEERLGSQLWDVVVLDEAQAIKNPDSRRARVARTLSARHRVALTGTPVENRLDDLWSLMEFLVPGLLGPRATFHRNVAVPVERFGDEEVATTLRRGVAPFLLRRVKTDPDVISDLPEKIERSDYTPLTSEQARLYRAVVEDAFSNLDGLDPIERRGRVLSMLTALKQVCNHPEQYLKEGGALAGRSGKLERCVELVDAILDLDERALVFTQYREMGTLLQRHLEQQLGEPVPFLHGGSSPKQRDEMVARFQEDPEACPVLLVSLRAGGTGLNLTRASHVIHFDRWWNPAVEDQATDRAYRIGQVNNVQVHKLVCEGTLEERIDALLTEKRALAQSIVGSGEQWVTELDDAALRELVMLSDDALVED